MIHCWLCGEDFPDTARMVPTRGSFVCLPCGETAIGQRAASDYMRRVRTSEQPERGYAEDWYRQLRAHQRYLQEQRNAQHRKETEAERAAEAQRGKKGAA